MIRCLQRLALVGLSTACATTTGTETEDEQPTAVRRCPPPGTQVPLAKLMNAAFAEEYAGCAIATQATFLVPGQMENYVFGMIPAGAMAGKVAFQAVAPGQSTEGGGGFGDVPPHVFVSKVASDIVFTLAKGDAIILRGAPVVGHSARMANGDRLTQVIFVATHVEKAQ